MDAATVTAIACSVTGSAGTLIQGWLRTRSRPRPTRNGPDCNYLRIPSLGNDLTDPRHQVLYIHIQFQVQAPK
jgi:hypothetical protein